MTTSPFSADLPNLLERHLAQLRDGSGLPIEVVRERGYRSAMGRKELADLGFAAYQCQAPALVVPVCPPDGTNGLYQIKPDAPRTGKNGKVVKYDTPVGRALRIDVPPRCRPLLSDATTTLWITEGAKKADKLAAEGACAVALLGVWSFRGVAVFGERTFMADFDLIALDGRDVRIVYDSDVSTKAPVRQAMVRLATMLAEHGARARAVLLPAGPSGAKVGADDFLLTHSLAELEALTDDTAVAPSLVEYCYADLRAEYVQWMWPGRMPFAKITVLDGDPGLGKSTVTLDIAARLTRGDRMPDGVFGDLEGPHAVLLLTAEDGPQDTVLPRLIALGANLELVFGIDTVPGPDGKPEMPAIPRDLAIIEERVRAHDIKLIIIDPLIAFLGDSSETNTWRDQDIRRALGPFAQMLARTGCATILVRHLNKASGGNPIYRGGGSIGIIGAARSGLLVQKDPDDDTGARRIMAPTKANLSAPAKAMAYHMEQAPGGSVRVVWEGETEHTAVGLLAEPLSEEDRSALVDAVDFLRAELYGNPVSTQEIKRLAGLAGISYRTIERARTKLHVIAEKTHGPQGGWYLKLPILPGTKAFEKAQSDA